MREILFRGKHSETNEWWYGDLFHTTKRVFIRRPIKEDLNDPPTCYEHDSVNPETVGQYTGLRDCKRTKEYPEGQKIFEGDIMPVWENGEEYHYKVIYNGDCFMLSMLDSEQGSYPLSVKNSISEIIGNIHDNPELLKGADDERKAD